MDYYQELLYTMVKYGYSVQVTPTAKGVRLQLEGKYFKGEKEVDSLDIAIGLSAYWLSETNGVPAEVKNAVSKILYRKPVLVFCYEVEQAEDKAAGINHYHDEIMVAVKSGDTGDDGEFASHMLEAIASWHVGAKTKFTKKIKP